MSTIGTKLRKLEFGMVAFHRPGCNDSHMVGVEPDPDGLPRPSWSFNGNGDAPTFTPSVLVTSGHYLSCHVAGKPCWCTYNADHPDDRSSFECMRCHSFVTDGRIRFLGDCTHALAGQTVDLPDYPGGDDA